MQQQRVMVMGYETFYREAGEGPPVLLIHGGDPGIGPASLLWDNNIDALAERGYHVFAPDRPGYGWSDGLRDSASHDVDHFVDHLEEFVDTCIGEPVLGLVGQSRGALLAAMLLMRRPAQFERLVVANTNSLAPAYGATIGAPAQRSGGTTQDRLKRLFFDPSSVSQAWWDEYARIDARPEVQSTQASHPVAREAYLSTLGKRKIEAIQWLRKPESARPTLLVWGVGDYMTTLGDGQAIFEILDRATSPVTMSVVNRCGHFPFLEYPTMFNDLLAKFLKTS